MRIITTALALGALMISPFAFAGEGFTAADADATGDVTLEEATAAMPDVTEEDFAEADADQSGALDEEEFATLEAPGATMEQEGAMEMEEEGATE